MFNKIQAKTSSTKIDSVTEPMQKYDVRHPIPGSKGETGKIIALDCEMVECENEIGAKCSKLARLSVVDYNGHVVWDCYYKPKFRITNYITRISGITPALMKDAPVYDDFEKEKVKLLLKDKVIVGHTLKSDFDAMELELQEYTVRDLMKFEFLKLEEGSGLKKMCSKYLGQSIQSGQHSSVIDARASLFIFRKFRNEINLQSKQELWESQKQERIKKQKSKPKTVNQNKKVCI